MFDKIKKINSLFYNNMRLIVDLIHESTGILRTVIEHIIIKYYVPHFREHLIKTFLHDCNFTTPFHLTIINNHDHYDEHFVICDDEIRTIHLLFERITDDTEKHGQNKIISTTTRQVSCSLQKNTKCFLLDDLIQLVDAFCEQSIRFIEDNWGHDDLLSDRYFATNKPDRINLRLNENCTELTIKFDLPRPVIV